MKDSSVQDSVAEMPGMSGMASATDSSMDATMQLHERMMTDSIIRQRVMADTAMRRLALLSSPASSMGSRNGMGTMRMGTMDSSAGAAAMPGMSGMSGMNATSSQIAHKPARGVTQNKRVTNAAPQARRRPTAAKGAAKKPAPAMPPMAGMKGMPGMGKP
jgi:hypothetical protein